MATRNLAEQVKVGLAAAAILSLIVSSILARLSKRAADSPEARALLEDTPLVRVAGYSLNAKQAFLAALLGLCLFATVNYAQYSEDVVFKEYDNYDLLHYYISAKYFDEVGYFNLIPALLIADKEAGAFCPGKVQTYLAQNEKDYYREPIEKAYAKSKEIKAHFTGKRWKEFVHDVTHIQRVNSWLSCKYWRELILDHGFNGTPVWILVARPIAKAVSVEDLKFATLIDLVLIIGLLYAVAWAFDRQTVLFAWLFIMLSYSYRWPLVGWAFLRYDWLAAMVVGLGCIKKERPLIAGACFGYATLMRYFPVIFLFGIVAKGVRALVERRDVPVSRLWLRVPTSYWRMAGGFMAVVVLVGGLSVAVDGMRPHVQSIENIMAHIEPHNLSSRRQGLSIALTYRGETEDEFIPDSKKELVDEIEPTLRIVALLALVAFGLFLGRTSDYEAVGLGLVPYFWLTTSSYYYYALRVIPVVIHARDLTKARNVFGLFMLFAIELFCNASEHIKVGNRYFLIGWMGVLLTVYTVSMAAFLGYEWWKERTAARAEISKGAPS